MVDEPLHTLPRAYALALRLRAIGADDGLISDCLELEPSAVPALLALAEAKLEAAEARDDAEAENGSAPRLGGRTYDASA